MKTKAISRLQPVGAQRYRESHGLYYDDFEVGDIYEHKPGRTITDADNIWQSLINSNNHPLHSDYHFASTTEFGRPVISSLVTFSIIGGLSLASTSGRAIANLGWKEVILSNPVFVGDTLYAESTVLSKRRSRSRIGQGVVTVMTRGLNQRGAEVLRWQRSFLVPTAGGGTPCSLPPPAGLFICRWRHSYANTIARGRRCRRAALFSGRPRLPPLA